jgi:hypothetical protein
MVETIDAAGHAIPSNSTPLDPFHKIALWIGTLDTHPTSFETTAGRSPQDEVLL